MTTTEQEIRRQRRIRRKRHRTLAMILILLLIVTGIVALAALWTTDVYQDEDEFKAFVDTQLSSGQMFTAEEGIKTEYEYGSPISYAVDYDVNSNDEINQFRTEKISEIKETFSRVKQKEEKERQEQEGDSFRYKPLQQALLVSSRTYESTNGVISLVIYEQDNTEHDREMVTETSKVYTYQFSEKSGNRLSPLQIFTENYREKCTSYFIDFFKKEYAEEKLMDGWEKFVSSDESNFNSFTLTDTGAVFFFDEGTVLKASEGVVSAGIPLEIMTDVMRTEIKERYIDPEKPMVAITYDDGPGGKSEIRILDCLQKNGAVATFFYQGYRISGNEDKVKRAYEMGCEIGCHTWDHPVLTDLNKSQVKKQLSRTNEAIKKACGAYPTVFRPSYGETNSKINKLSKMPVIMWSVDTQDWKVRNGKKVFKSIKKAKNLDGKIILMHSIHDSTAKATELIVPYLKKKGYQFVTVSELIKYKYGEQPEKGKVYR